MDQGKSQVAMWLPFKIASAFPELVTDDSKIRKSITIACAIFIVDCN